MPAPATRNSTPNYVTTPEAWSAFRKSAKEAGASSTDSILTKADKSRPAGVMKSRDDVAAFLAKAPADVREEAIERFPEKAAGGDSGDVVAFVISDASEDRDDDVVSLDGWDLGEHKRNPVCLWAHKHGMPAVGLGLGTHVADAALRSILYANPKDVDPFGFMVGRMCALRIVRACSVGFIPKLYAFNQERGDWAIDFLKQELIEWSPCNVGCNRNALSEARSVGVDVSPFVDEAIKTLDGEGGLWLPRAELEGLYRDLTGAKLVSVPNVDALRTSFVANVKAIATKAAAPTKVGEIVADVVPLPAGVELRSNGELVDWKAVAVDMAKGVAPSVAVRSHTFAKAEGLAALGDRKGIEEAAAQLEKEEQQQQQEKKPEPARGIDPSADAGKNHVEDPEALGADEVRAMTERIEAAFDDLKTEITGRVP